MVDTQVWSMMERSVAAGNESGPLHGRRTCRTGFGSQGPVGCALFLPPHPEAKRLSHIRADDGKKGTSTLGLLKLVTEIDEATRRSRIRKLAGPITDQYRGARIGVSWIITSVEQERKLRRSYQEMRGLWLNRLD